MYVFLSILHSFGHCLLATVYTSNSHGVRSIKALITQKFIVVIFYNVAKCVIFGIQ